MQKRLGLAVAALGGLAAALPAAAQEGAPEGSAVAGRGSAQELRPLGLSRASVIGLGQTELFLGAVAETGREAGGRGNAPEDGDYDNFRLGPVGFRHGLMEGFEYGAYASFANNSADDAGAPDESGFEGVTGFAKLALSEQLAVEFGARLGGDDELYPYPNDGLDFYVNLPLQRRIGEGLAYAELGYTVRDDADVPGGNYANWGVGYAYPLDAGTTLNAELRGDENPTGSNHMELLLGAGLQIEQIHLRPYVGLGVYDASPDLAAGVSASLPLGTVAP
ncbi:hypothetical protein [Halorhodospira neutriphila]|uniref:hypothetical protein n=1 Tax=Halorhodospira neutriphila TaxID=168379 RepID=UPI001905AE83|nr:hypothetical protein [Halorhodospira neutriphila]